MSSADDQGIENEPKHLPATEVNPMHTSIILDNNTSGYLRRQGKGVSGSVLHRKRWYTLDGSILSKQATETSVPTWHANILGGTVQQLGKLCFVIVLRDPATQGDESRLILYAKTDEVCKKWVQCLHSAATRTLERLYQIGEVIGEGGFASVRLGQCRKTEKIVAIKTICKEKEFMKLYGREIAVIKRVNHENIVRTYDLFETDKKIHIVMEYMKGGMLFEAIEDGKLFSELDVAQLMREVLHGVMYLHDNGIVHRDLKPENVLCTDTQPPWHLKLADFGLSKFTQNGGPSTDMLMRTMIGTPEFIAPEIAKKQDYTSKVDMWAVGMLMYNVVTGKLPFDEEDSDFIGILRRGLRLTFPEPQWAEYSPEALLFTRALLCPEPEKRLTALAALVHPWLDSEERFGSSRFSAHGRFSMRPSTNLSLELDSLKRPRKSVFFGNNARKKPSWAVAFIAVRAMNRFLLLVRPKAKEVDSPTRVQSVGKSASSSAFSDTITDFEALSEDEGDEGSPSSAKSFPHSPHGTAEYDYSDGPPSSSKVVKFMHRHEKLAGPLRKASGLLIKSPQGPARKASLLGRLHGKTTHGSPPVSSPLASKPKDAAAAVNDFDDMLGLGDLEISNVDDEPGLDGPASLFGVKHMHLIGGKAPRMSPGQLKRDSTGKQKQGYKSRLQQLNLNSMANSSFTKTRVHKKRLSEESETPKET